MFEKKYVTIAAIVMLISCSGARDSSLTDIHLEAQQRLSVTQTALISPEQTAWDLMLTLIWPASGQSRGTPDLSKTPGPNQVPVWSTWKSSVETYLPNGTKPAAWDDISPENKDAVDELLNNNQPMQIAQVSTFFPADAKLLDNHGNPIYYTVRLNKAVFDTIVTNQLYNVEGIIALASALLPEGRIFTFPSDAIEIKAAWKRLYPEDDESRYFTRIANINIPGGEKANNIKVGLTGLHIMSKIVPNWFFTTFEQVDNAKTTNIAILGGLPAPIPKNVAAINTKMQALLKEKNSPWQYYNCMGTESQNFNIQTGVPTRLGNSQIETLNMSTSSCIACHAHAGAGLTPLKKKPFLYNPMAGMLANKVPIGFIGAPNPVDFYPNYVVPNIPDPKTAIYMQTDFVWSIPMEANPINPSINLNFACVKDWFGPTGPNGCIPVSQLDQ